MNEIWLVYSTFPNKEKALSAARALLDARLIACANVIENVTSVYHWEGHIQQEPEAIMMAKTHKERVARALEAIKQLHPYQLPCITAYEIGGGYTPFLQWVADETLQAQG
jgi:periplasmic divalent cation tolerance protein